MEEIKLPESVYAPRIVLTSTELQSRSKIALNELPSQSRVCPGDNKDIFWTVGDGGVMVPTGPNLQDYGIASISDAHKLEDGVKALVPITISATFVKKDGSWKRFHSAGANVQLTTPPPEVAGPPGHGNFLNVQSANYGGGQIQAPLPDVPLQIVLSEVPEDGTFAGSNQPVFQGLGNGVRKMSIIAAVVVGLGGTTVKYKTPQLIVWSGGNSITKGDLVKHAAAAVTNLMAQEKSNGSPLCAHDLEIDPMDLLLVKLKQVSQGTLHVEIAYRNI